MSNDVLEVISIERRTTARRFKFLIITCREVTILENGNIEPKGRVGVRTLWADRPVKILNPSDHQIIHTRWRGDIEYETISVGDLFSAKVIEFSTTPYSINGTIANTFNCVIWKHDRDQIRAAAKELRYLRYQASPLDSNGRPYVYESTVREISDGENPDKA